MPNLHIEKLEIPTISDELLEELYGRIKPLVRDQDGNLRFIKDVDPRRTAYSWLPEYTGTAESVYRLGSFATLHTFGAPVFFKPSVAEVLAQIPAGYLDVAKAFEVIGPISTSGLNMNTDAVNAGFHVAETYVYGNQ